MQICAAITAKSILSCSSITNKMMSATEATLIVIAAATKMILATEKVITVTLNVVSSTTKVILATEEVTTTTFKVILATT